MFQWVSEHNLSLEPGHSYSIAITPQYPDYAVNSSGGLMVVAYCGNAQGSYYVGGSPR